MNDRSLVERQWFHEAHGLHDDAHHQAHRPLVPCVPLVFRSDYDSLVQKLQAAEERATDRDYWYGQARNRAFRNAQDELQSTKEQLQAERIDRSEWREGMVTVYDYEGQYVGCMGEESWTWLFQHGYESLKSERDHLLRLRGEDWRRGDEQAAEIADLQERLKDAQRKTDRRIGIADRLLVENQRLRELLDRLRPDIDPDTGYGNTESV